MGDETAADDRHKNLGQEDNSENESSDEEDSSDGEEMEIGNEEIQLLEKQVAANSTDYQTHVKLIAALRRHGILEKLRTAREAMNVLFPLSPVMWKEWTQDEARLASDSADVENVVALFERGVEEYLSVPLWEGYVEFVQERAEEVAQCTPGGVARMRSVFERALIAGGLHFAEGAQLWAAYREWEQALQLVIPEDDAEARSKQRERVRSLYWRQLAVPLANHADTLEEYREWEEMQGGAQKEEGTDSDLSWLPANVLAAYRKAAAMSEARTEMEAKVGGQREADGELLASYLAYVTLEEGTGDPVRVQNLYERAVATFPITPDLWLKYTGYLDSHLKVHLVIKGAYKRAVRNCPWVGALWSSYLLALERALASEAELAEVYHGALQGGLQTAEEYLDVCLRRMDELRRRARASTEKESTAAAITSMIREAASHMRDFLASYFPNFADRSLQLHAYWAEIECSIADDVAAARVIWEDLIKASGWMVEAWQGYINMELKLGNIREGRALFRRCYNRRFEGSGTEAICASWLRFEREHGTLDDYDVASAKVAPRIAEVRALVHKSAASRPLEAVPVPKPPGRMDARNLGKPKPGPGDRGAMPPPSGSGKRKLGLGYKEKDEPAGSAAKKARGYEGGGAEEGVAEEEKQGAGGSGEGVARKASEGGGDAQMAEAGEEKEERPVYKDQCTAFVSNLAFEVQEKDLEELFAKCGGMKAVRVVRDKFTGRSKGFAYVDFETEEALAAAIELNRSKLMSRPMSVARSAPPSKGGGRGRGGDRGAPPRGRGGNRGGRGNDYNSGGGRGRGELTDGGRGGRSGRGYAAQRKGGHLQLTPATVAVPRAIARSLGWGGGAGGSAPADGEPVKSNEEFRKMFLKKTPSSGGE